MKFIIATLLATTTAVSLRQMESKGGDGKEPTVREVVDWIFKHTDSNEDGYVSHEEYVTALEALAKEHEHTITDEDRKEADEVFAKLDKNGDGQVSKKELRKALRKVRKLAKMFMEKMDKNDDGKIQKWEFKKAIRELAAEHDVELEAGDMKEALTYFDDADLDNNGEVTMQELKLAIMKHMELEDISDVNMIAEHMMEEFDKNGDGKISRKEYKKTMIAFAKAEGHKLTKDEKKVLMEMFEFADHDDSGKVNMFELKAAIAVHIQTEKILEDFDRDGNNEISLKEFKKAMKKALKAGEIDEEEVEETLEHFKEADKDGSGSVSYEEIARALQEELYENQK